MFIVYKKKAEGSINMDWIKIMEATPSCALKAQEGVSYAFGLETWNYARFFWEEEVSTNSSLSMSN